MEGGTFLDVLCCVLRQESVRKAADIALRTVSRVSIKMCDVQQGRAGEAAISAVLPTLLKTGLGSQVEEVRAIR